MNLSRASVGFAALLLCAVPLLVHSTPPQAVPAAATVSHDLNLTFTPIDYPGSNYTGVWGINSNGDMVGNYGSNIETNSHGFLLRDGVYTSFDYPGESKTVAAGINDSGLIVGYTGDLRVRGFLYDGTSFTRTIRNGSNTATVALGINNAGQVVGGFGTAGATRGFILRGQQFKVLSPPPGGWIYVYARGVNNLGEVVGWDSGSGDDGFTYMNGTYQTIAFPGSSLTEALGINDGDILVGWYSAEGCLPCGFAYKNGTYLSFNYPGAYGTLPTSINNAGQVVGQYQLSDGSLHGFITSPITATDFDER